MVQGPRILTAVLCAALPLWAQPAAGGSRQADPGPVAQVAQADRAAQPGRMSQPDPVDQLVWTASAVQQMLADRDYPLALALGLVNRAVEQRGAAGAGAAVELLTALQQRRPAFEACRSGQPLEGAVCALEQLHSFAPATLRGELAEEASRLIGLALRPEGTPVGQVGSVALGAFGALGGFGAAGGPGGRGGLGVPGAAGTAGTRVFAQVPVGPAAVAGMSGVLADPFQRYVQHELERVWRTVAHEPALVARARAPADPVLGPVSAPVPVVQLERALRQALGTSPVDAGAVVLAGNATLHGLLERYPVLAALAQLGLTGGDVVEARRGGTPTLADAAALSAVVQHSHAFFNGMVDSARASVRGLVAADSVTAAALGAGLTDWAANRSFVYLAARAAALAGGADAERAAGAIAAVGNAGADLQRLLSGFSAQLGALADAGVPGGAGAPGVLGALGTFGSLGSLGALGSLGERAAVLALSGGVFGIASNLTALLGAAGGGGAHTAREVQALRGVVDTLRLELHDRFTHVDVALDSMFGVLSSSFDRLHVALASGQQANRRELAAIHNDVAALGRGLTRLEENLHSYMHAAYDQDYHRTLVRCLEHRSRHVPPFDELDFPTFSGCLTEFRVRAVRDAKSAILADHGTATDDVALLGALADTDMQNLARRLPLLARTAATRFGNPGLQPRGGIANPVEWAVASQAYLTMLYDWPAHARGMTADDLEDMASVGRELRDVVSNVTVDAQGRPRAAFFDALLGNYERHADALRAQVAAVMSQHETERLRRVPLDSAVRTLRPAEQAGPVTAALPAPARLVDALPADLKAAAILGLDSLVLSYRVTQEDSVVRDEPRRRLFVGLRPFGRVHERRHYARTHVAIDVHYGTLGRVATYEAVGPYTLRRTEQMGGGHDSERVRRAVDHVPDAGRHFLDHEWPYFAAGQWHATHTDAAALRSARDGVEAALRVHAGAVLDDLLATVCTGAEEPRSGATREDAARLRATLDGLSAARALLAAYATVGLSYSLDTRPLLRRALLERDGLFDRAALCGAVAGRQSVLRLVWLDDEPQRRMAALRGELADVLAEPARLPEPLPLVEQTLHQLETAARVQRLRSAAARAPGEQP
jgi:hypothetical protein